MTLASVVGDPGPDWNGLAIVLDLIVPLVLITVVVFLTAGDWLSHILTRRTIAASVNRGMRRMLREAEWTQTPAPSQNVVEPRANAVSPVTDAASRLRLKRP